MDAATMHKRTETPFFRFIGHKSPLLMNDTFAIGWVRHEGNCRKNMGLHSFEIFHTHQRWLAVCPVLVRILAFLSGSWPHFVRLVRICPIPGLIAHSSGGYLEAGSTKSVFLFATPMEWTDRESPTDQHYRCLVSDDLGAATRRHGRQPWGSASPRLPHMVRAPGFASPRAVSDCQRTAGWDVSVSLERGGKACVLQRRNCDGPPSYSTRQNQNGCADRGGLRRKSNRPRHFRLFARDRFFWPMGVASTGMRPQRC